MCEENLTKEDELLMNKTIDGLFDNMENMSVDDIYDVLYTLQKKWNFTDVEVYMIAHTGFITDCLSIDKYKEILGRIF